MILKKNFLQVLAGLIIYLLLANSGYGNVPRLLNYQGRLVDKTGKSVPNGTYNITFCIYNVPTEGSPLWNETQSVNTSDGVFSVILGSVSLLNLSFNENYWLGIKVESDSEMTPRQRITSAGYSINTDTLDGKHSTDFAPVAHTHGTITDADNDTRVQAEKNADEDKIRFDTAGVERMTIDETGKVGIGVVSPNDKLHINDGNIRISGSGKGIYFPDGSFQVQAGVGSASSLSNNLDAVIIGDGDANNSGRVILRTGSNDRVTVINSGDVGIGTSSPKAKLHVVGNATLGSIVVSPNDSSGGKDSELLLTEDNNGTYGMKIKYDGGDNHIYFYGKSDTTTYGPHVAINRDNGNVGIGTKNPSKNLHVVGSATLGSVMISPNETTSDDDSELILTEDDDGTYGMKIKYDGLDNRIYIYGKFDTDIYGPHIAINRNDGKVGIGTKAPDRILEIGSGKGNARADGWDVWSSKEYKKDIASLDSSDYEDILRKVGEIDVVKYRYKREDDDNKLRIGVIAEEAPKEIISEDKRAMSLSDSIGFLIAAIKAQQQKILALEKEITKLKNSINVVTNNPLYFKD